jgi:hypothetical protein
MDPQVKYFDAGGNILGTARQNPQSFYKDYNHHLALDQDGAVYQLLSTRIIQSRSSGWDLLRPCLPGK